MKLSNDPKDYIPYTMGLVPGQQPLTWAEIMSMCDDDVRPTTGKG